MGSKATVAAPSGVDDGYPARGDAAAIAFTLPGGAVAKLEVLDVAGRCVFTHDASALGRGAACHRACM
jgi:hypothetical protein